MGNISTITLLNDTLSQLEDDPEFGKKVARAVRSFSSSNGPEHIGHYAYVVDCHHIQFNRMVKVGGHVGEVISELIPLSLRPARMTKKKAIELLEILTPKLESLFQDYSSHLLLKVIDLLKKEKHTA